MLAGPVSAGAAERGRGRQGPRADSPIPQSGRPKIRYVVLLVAQIRRNRPDQPSSAPDRPSSASATAQRHMAPDHPDRWAPPSSSRLVLRWWWRRRGRIRRRVRRRRIHRARRHRPGRPPGRPPGPPPGTAGPAERQADHDDRPDDDGDRPEHPVEVGRVLARARHRCRWLPGDGGRRRGGCRRRGAGRRRRQHGPGHRPRCTRAVLAASTGPGPVAFNECLTPGSSNPTDRSTARSRSGVRKTQ